MKPAIAIADYNVALSWGLDVPDRRFGVNKFAPNFPLGIYRCKNGWIGVTVVTSAQWKTFCQLLGLEELIGDPRYSSDDDRLRYGFELEACFADRFLARTADEWFAIGLEQRMPFVVVPTWPICSRARSTGGVRSSSNWRTVPHLRSAGLTAASLVLSPPKSGGAVPAAGADQLAWKNDGERPHPASSGSLNARPERPLSGLRIVDLSMGWAGPSGDAPFRRPRLRRYQGGSLRVSGLVAGCRYASHRYGADVVREDAVF